MTTAGWTATMRYRFANFELDPDLYQLLHEGHPVPAEPKVIDLLVHLIERRGVLVSKAELLATIWPDVCVGESSLTRTVAVARKLIGDSGQRFIKTVYGRGYHFAAPVTVLGRDDAAADDPACPVSPPASERPFIGRRHEQETFTLALGEAAAGRGGMLLLEGEAGIGKTRTAEQLLAEAARAGTRVRSGRCRESEGAPAFWPWVQILREELAHTDRARVVTLLGSGARDLEQLVPELESAAPAATLEPRQSRFRMFDGVTRLLTALALEEPRILFFDDLHRADHSSLELLRFLAVDLPKSHLLVVGSYRDADLKRNPERAGTLAEIARECGARHLELQRFALEEVGDFVVAVSGRALPEDELRVLLDATAGNPFFLTQLVPLIRENRLRDPEGRASVHLPRGVCEVVAHQLSGVSRETQELLDVAAVIGREFSLSLLSDASGVATSEVLARLAPVLAAGTLCTRGARPIRYSFAHALLRDALYDRLDAARRALLHRRVAEALAELSPASATGGHLTEVAHHFLQAAATGCHEQAIESAIRAASWASERFAYDEAIHHYRDALDLIGIRDQPPSERCDLLLALAEAQARAGRREDAKTTLREATAIAARLGSPERLARAALCLAPGFFSMEAGVYDEFLVTLLERALQALPEVDSNLRAQLLARLSLALHWSETGDHWFELSNDARSMAQRLGHSASRSVLPTLLLARWGIEGVDRRLELAKDLMDSQAAGAEAALLGAVLWMASLLGVGDVNRIERELPSLRRLAVSIGHPQAIWYVALFEGIQALLRGEFEEAEKLAARFFEMGRKIRDENATHAMGGFMVTIRWEQDRIGETIGFVEDLVRHFPYVSGWRAALAWVYFQAERLDRAVAEMTRLEANGFMDKPPKGDWQAAVVLLAEIAVGIRDSGRCDRLFQLLRPCSHECAVFGICVSSWGPISRSLGLLATTLERWDEAIQYFEESIRISGRMGAKPWLARTKASYARALLARRRPEDREKAKSLLRQSQQLARSLGMVRLLKELGALHL